MSVYSEKLKTVEWKKMVDKVRNRDDYQCKRCGAVNRFLHVHHQYYLPERDPWDYPMECFVTLCDTCHEKEHELLRSGYADIRLMMGSRQVSAEELISVSWILYHILGYLKPKELIEVLNEKLDSLIEERGVLRK